MKSVIRPIRLPHDLDEGVLHLMAKQEKKRSTLVRGALLLAWGDFFATRLGAQRVQELMADYANDMEDENDSHESNC